MQSHHFISAPLGQPSHINPIIALENQTPPKLNNINTFMLSISFSFVNKKHKGDKDPYGRAGKTS